jgi:sirohydrochlorin ferrochelatase
MELAPPTVAEAFDACVAEGADEVIVHPYFLGPGNHASVDIPRLVAQAAAGHPHVRAKITEPLGVHDKIGEIIVDRIRSAREVDKQSMAGLRDTSADDPDLST